MGQGMREIGRLGERGGEQKGERTQLFSRPFIIFLPWSSLLLLHSEEPYLLSLLHLDSDYSAATAIHLIY